MWWRLLVQLSLFNDCMHHDPDESEHNSWITPGFIVSKWGYFRECVKCGKIWIRE